MDATTRGDTSAAALEVRDQVVEALQLDLVGPWAGHVLEREQLPGWERPSNWYLTGFLVPTDAPAEQRADDDADDDMPEVSETEGLTEESADERTAARKGFFPSSIGLSTLVGAHATALSVTVRWGDYEPITREDVDDDEQEPPTAADDDADGLGRRGNVWQRTPREELVTIALAGRTGPLEPEPVPSSGGLEVQVLVR